MGFEDRFLYEKQRLGENCRRIRKSRKIFQHQIGTIININLSAPRISDIENGKQNVEFETLYKLKMGLQCDIKYFFYEETFPVDKIVISTTTLELEKKLFSQRLAQLLAHRSVSQIDLSILIKMGEGDISYFVNAQHNIELLSIVKIAEALKLNLETLFDYNGPLPDNTGFRQEIIS